MNRVQTPLVVITGPTASGKTDLALRLAERWGGEIICADSRTVYRHMDIGTAKPTKEEQARVPHWCLDVVDPGERFTVADFQYIAKDAIADIRSRGKIPFLVGGTGLYIDSVVLSYDFGPKADLDTRKDLEIYSVAELQMMLKQHHMPMPENHKNKRYLIRSYEKNNTSTSGKTAPDDDTITVAIKTEMTDLEQRIIERSDRIFASKILQETQHILDNYGANSEAFTGNIYPIIKQYFDGSLSYDEARSLSCIRDRQLVKRQLTWLKRHSWIQWLPLDDAEQYFDNILSNFRDGVGQK